MNQTTNTEEACVAGALRALRQYAPSDATERAFADRMVTLIQGSGASALQRTHFTPGHLTASAFVLSPRADALLLIFHGKLRRWLQPGGHVDPTDPSIMAAAQREVAEEVGLTSVAPHPDVQGIFDVDVHTIPARRDEPEHAHFDVRFLFVAPHASVNAGSDAQAAQWVEAARLGDIESDESVLRAVRKLRDTGLLRT